MSHITLVSLALLNVHSTPKPLFCNYLFIVSVCINLFHMFIQTRNKVFSPFNVSFTVWKRRSNTICQKSIFNPENCLWQYKVLKCQHNSKYFSCPFFQYTCLPFSVYVCSMHKLLIIVQQLGHFLLFTEQAFF